MWTLLPYVLVTLAIVLIPGLVVNIALGFRATTALALAPLVSTAIVAASAIAADLVGVGWGPLPIVVATVLFGLAGFAVRKLTVRLGWAEPAPTNPSQLQGERLALGWSLAGFGTALVILGRDALRIIGSPINFSQTYDNIFHLNALRWILEHRNGSALNLRMVTGDAPPGFYPTAWHDLASAGSITLGVSEPVFATNALTIVTLAVIWPLGCLLLFRRIVAPSRVGMVAVGVLTACFTAFPYMLMGFGVLYPNYLGLCLLPAMMAIAVELLGLADEQSPRWPRLTSWLAAGFGMVALLLAHPNVALTMISVIGLAMIIDWALSAISQAVRERQWTLRTSSRLLVLLGWTAAAIGIWIKIRPPADTLTWGPPRSLIDAVIELGTLSPMEAAVVWVPALLTPVGVLAVIVNRRGWWLLLAHGAASFLWLIAAARGMGRLRDLLVGPFYNDPFRLAALLPITALPLAGLGVGLLVRRLQPVVPRWNDGVAAVLVGVLLIGSTQFAGGKPEVVGYARWSYQMSPDAPLVDSDEYAVIMQVPEFVPADEVIAVNPWNGSSMVYALTGRQTTSTHVFYEADDDTQVLIDHLDEATSDPEVCPILLDLDVEWVLDFGTERAIHDRELDYPGWDELASSPGFELVAEQGHAALYQVTACGLG